MKTALMVFASDLIDELRSAYGRPEPSLDRQFLHAAELAFPHPITGERLALRSELPNDLATYLVLNQHKL